MSTHSTRGGPAIGRIFSLIAISLATAASLVAPGTAGAQGFPAKPIRLIVGYTPGGSNDIAARILAPRLAEALNTTVLVENKPGASGALGSDYVAKSPPDG